MSDRLDTLLARFRDLSGSRGGAPVFQYDGGEHDLHVCFGTMVHGNEIGSLPAAVRLLEALDAGNVTYGGKLTVFVGNPEAGRADARFLDRDLNRLFGVSHDTETHEGRRALELQPLIDAADWFIDFHQTILEAAHAFYIGPWSRTAWHIARAVAATDVWVTFPIDTGIGCADEYAAGLGKPSITLELGEKGFNPYSEQVAWRAMQRTIALADQIAGGADLQALAEARDELSFWETTHRERYQEGDKLAPGWINFQPVEAGTRLSAPGRRAIVAPTTGAVLFPKYFDPEKEPPKEIYRIIQPMTDHPTERYE